MTYLRIRWPVIVMLVLVLLPLGCKKKVGWGGADQEEVEKNPLAKDGRKQPAQGHITRGVEKQLNQNDLKQIALYYTYYRDENGKPPATEAEFKAYLQRDPNARNLVKVLEDDIIVVVPNVQPTSTNIVAYEKHVFALRNHRMAAFGDSHVETMQDPDFQRKLKEQQGP